MHVSLMRSLGLSLLLVLSLAACKQGEFETCQIDSDCDDGLECTTIGSHGECRPIGGSQGDGGIPAVDALDGDAAGDIDAQTIDASPIDAAAADAAPIDASPPDALI
jgi:hypothetical protein